MKKYANVFWVVVIMVLGAWVSVVSQINIMGSNGYKLCGLDGVFYFSNINSLIKILFPVIILYINLYGMRYSFQSYYIVRQESRMVIWNRMCLNIYKSCVITMVISMAVSGITVWLQTGVWDAFSQHNSLFYRELSEIYGEGRLVTNKLFMLASSLLLNSVGLYLHVISAMLAYWMTDSKVIAFVTAFAFNLIPDSVTLFDYSGDIFCYREICCIEYTMRSVIYIAVGLFLLIAAAAIYVPRKNFYKS